MALVASVTFCNAVVVLVMEVFCGEAVFTSALAPVGPEPDTDRDSADVLAAHVKCATVLVMMTVPVPNAEMVLPAEIVPPVITFVPLKPLLLPLSWSICRNRFW